MQEKAKTFRPSSVLTIYTALNKPGSYIEVADIMNLNGKYKEGPARPLSRDVMRNLINTVFEEKELSKKIFNSNYIGEHILYFIPEKHNRRIVWYRKAAKMDLIFSDNLKISPSKMWMPAMLLDVNLDSLYIYSLAENKRPQLNTKLYHPPILNLIHDNYLCWGGVKTKIPEQITIDDEIKLWEAYLWKSEFAHAGSAPSTKTDIVKLLRRLGKSGEKFPVKELKETRKTLGTILR